MSEHNNGKHHHHIVPDKVYFRIFGTLIVGTIVTVAASYVDLGSANMVVAMLIATVKALLVMLFFMGLRYDGKENNITIFSTFLFLAIFITLSSADLFYRVETHEAPVDASDLVVSTEGVDVNRLRLPSPDLLEKGKGLFAQNCATCHGANGLGDGPAAAALNPKPRNFTTNEWKKGGSPARVFLTITNGLPGTPMPGFSTLSVEERFALAHYVRHFAGDKAPSVNEDTPEVIASLGIGKAPKPRLTIEKAMQKLAVPE